ncbi:hypothetical protein ONS96_012704 [Cadophora gregata f. sp. sojae]|nr:hypothetical protein ONS96_012704 [Cadophora gregata f. sp. sojae]
MSGKIPSIPVSPHPGKLGNRTVIYANGIPNQGVQARTNADALNSGLDDALRLGEGWYIVYTSVLTLLLTLLTPDVCSGWTEELMSPRNGTYDLIDLALANRALSLLSRSVPPCKMDFLSSTRVN